MKYGIDLGHNCAFDGGAVGIKTENSLIMSVGNRVMSKLKALGHTVVDCRPRKAGSLGHSLRQRTYTANTNKVDQFVSIHFNAFNSKAHGTEVLYISQAGKRIAQPVLQQIASLGFYDRGLKYRDNLHVLKATSAPAILIECCFCDSQKDMALFDAEKMANAIVKGLTGEDVESNCKCA